MEGIEIDSIPINIANLMSFIFNFKYLATSIKLNTCVLFILIDLSKPKLFSFSSPLIINAQSIFLLLYLDQTLRLYLIIFLLFGSLICYQESDFFISCKNLLFIWIQPDIIKQNIALDLFLGRIIEIDPPTSHSISYLLGLVVKHDRGFQKIHHLFYLLNSSINNFITSKVLTLSYFLLQNIFTQIVIAKRYTVLIK